MMKRFYIEVTCSPFNGKLTIEVDAGSEKQAWEKVNDLMTRRMCQLKTTHVLSAIGNESEETSDDQTV
jgi:hypothetical protein